MTLAAVFLHRTVVGSPLNIALLVSLSLNAFVQICYDICAEELPAFQYFGTQYSWEVRSVSSFPPPPSCSANLSKSIALVRKSNIGII